MFFPSILLEFFYLSGNTFSGSFLVPFVLHDLFLILNLSQIFICWVHANATQISAQIWLELGSAGLSISYLPILPWLLPPLPIPTCTLCFKHSELLAFSMPLIIWCSVLGNSFFLSSPDEASLLFQDSFLLGIFVTTFTPTLFCSFALWPG